MEKFSIKGYNKKSDQFCSFSDYNGETYTLYISTSKTPTKRTKVADNVTVHSALKNGDILYISNKELFLYKGGKAVSLFKEEGEEEIKYILSKAQDKLLIVPGERNYGKEKLMNVYLIDIYTGNNTVYSDFNINSFDYSFELDSICYFRDNAVYQLEDGNSKEIVKGIKEPYNSVTYSSDKVIYASKADEPTSLYRFDFNGNEELVSDSFEKFVEFNIKENFLAYTEKNSEGKIILKVVQNGETLGEYEDIEDGDDVYRLKEAHPSKSKYWYFFSEENKKLWKVALEGSKKGEIELVNDNVTDFLDFAYSQDSKAENDDLLYKAKIKGNDYYSLFLDKNIINENVGKYYSPAHLENNGTETYIIYTDTLSQTSYEDDNDTYHIWENGRDTVIAKNVKDYINASIKQEVILSNNEKRLLITKEKAIEFIYSKVDNQILQFLKERKIEVNEYNKEITNRLNQNKYKSSIKNNIAYNLNDLLNNINNTLEDTKEAQKGFSKQINKQNIETKAQRMEYYLKHRDVGLINWEN